MARPTHTRDFHRGTPVPSLAADPPSAESYLYYNSTAKTLRLFDGAAWQTLAVVTAATTYAGPGAASGSGAALNAGTKNVAPQAGVASGAGAASAAMAHVKATAGLAAGTGAANNATVVVS